MMGLEEKKNIYEDTATLLLSWLKASASKRKIHSFLLPRYWKYKN